MTTDSEIQSTNWCGSIPVVLTLAPTSLSSPTLPPPIHVQLSRQTYLHVGLQSAVLRLHRFAPSPLSFASGVIRSEPDPGTSVLCHGDSGSSCVDDANDGSNDNEEAVTIGNNASEGKNKKPPPYPVCWFEDEEKQIALRWHLFVGILYDLMKPQKQQPSSSSLPWKIRLHFTTYPSSQILSLEGSEVLGQVKHFFKNSLKQALCLQYGNSKAAMNLNKESHGRLWESVQTANFLLYKQENNHSLLHMEEKIPVRLFVDSKPPIQKACLLREASNQETSKEDVSPLTLGWLLVEWLPDYFSAEDGKTVATNNCQISWRVAGIQPPLETSLVDLWKNLCHPDHFLYITVRTD